MTIEHSISINKIFQIIFFVWSTDLKWYKLYPNIEQIKKTMKKNSDLSFHSLLSFASVYLKIFS
jgi:hypothetical protein